VCIAQFFSNAGRKNVSSRRFQDLFIPEFGHVILYRHSAGKAHQSIAQGHHRK
jgi:hypothetical protein